MGKTMWTGRIMTAMLFLSLFMVPAVFAADAGRSAPQREKILILHSYHKAAWTDALLQGIETALEPLSNFDFFIEYMDTKRNSTPEYLKLLEKAYHLKYRGVSLRAIIATDNDALDFVISHRQDIFRGVPLVFCGVNDFEPAMLHGDKLVTGVVEKNDFEDNFNILALARPAMKKLYVITDSTAAGQMNRYALVNEVKRLRPDLKMIFSDQMELPQLRDMLRNAAPEDAAFFIAFWSEAGGAAVSPAQLETVFRDSAVPVFGRSEWMIGNGLVGGKCVSGYQQGYTAGMLLRKILSGTPIAALPVITDSPNIFMFDYSLMEKYRIPPAIAPQGSTVLNRPQPFYRVRKPLFMMLMCTLLVLGSVVVLLVLNIRRLRRADRALADKEVLYNTLVDNMHIGVNLIDKDFTIITTNKKQADMLGMNQEEVVGRKCYEIFEKRDHVCNHCPGVSAMRENMPFYIETQLLRDDGNTITVGIHAFPVNDSNGVNQGYIEMVEDVTIRQKSETQTLEQVWFFEGLNRINRVLQQEHEPDKMHGGVLQALLPMFRCSRAFLLGKDDSGKQIKITHLAAATTDFQQDTDKLFSLSELDRATIWARIEVAPDPVSFDYSSRPTWLFPDAHMAMAAAINPRNGPIRILVIEQCRLKHVWTRSETILFKEIANRLADGLNSLNVTAELIRNEEDIRITLNSIGEGVIATDQYNRIVRMNPVAESVTGWSYDEALGKNLDHVFKICHLHSRTPATAILTDIIHNGAVDTGTDVILVQRDGKERQISQSSTPIRNRDGNICGIVIVFRDITGQRMMEEELRQAQKMESVGRLAGGIAHDFNNMLCAMLGAATALQKRLELNESNGKLLDVIISSARHAASLTEKLLMFSRKGHRFFTKTDMHEIIRDTVNILQHSIDRRISVKLELNASIPLVNGDVSQLHNAILNLGINARDAMPEGGKITIATANVILDQHFCHGCPFKLIPGEYLKVSVRDTGIGMTAEIKAKIFEPFFTTKEVGKGTGLGLAATYGTVVDHNGAIQVESEPGHGTSVDLYFPLAAEVKSQTAAPPAEQLKSGCVLVVDDEPTVRIIASEILQDLGFEVITAENGREGLELFRQHQDKVVLVLLDMIMPVMNGRDCFFELRNIRPDLKVIMSSGFSQDAMVAQLKKDGVCGFVAKPYQINDLSKLVFQVLAPPES